MILAVEYLHKRKIVYRDIKPENIMIDEKGYLKLIDMGTAKILKSENGIARTFTILGTPHYMAPEILKSKGYGLNVDLWSIGIVFIIIGVTLYEFMCGLVPFGEECDDPYQVYQLIISNTTLSFPRYFDANSNKYAKLMMEQLLNRLPEARLGGSYAALKAHKWFDRFDWDSLLDMKLTPPYTPPANKMYSNQEMENIANMRIPVTQEIEKSASKFKKTKKNVVSKIPNWDKDF
jgi:cGMP-dependent protein kinase